MNLLILFQRLLGRDRPSHYYYGHIIGHGGVQARKHRVTGIVEIKYRDKNEHAYATDSWAECRPEYRNLFWHIIEKK